MYGNHPNATKHKRDLKRNARLRWADRATDGHETINGQPVKVDLRVRKTVV